MGESLDIVRYIDQGRLKEEVRPEVQAWLDKVGEYNNKLVQPRMVKIGLPEFETDEAKKYFIDKKEKSIGNFDTNLNKNGTISGAFCNQRLGRAGKRWCAKARAWAVKSVLKIS